MIGDLDARPSRTRSFFVARDALTPRDVLRNPKMSKNKLNAQIVIAS
jgi:hypothetical protein